MKRMLETNAFGQKIPEIRELLREPEVAGYVRDTLITVLQALDIPNPVLPVEEVLGIAGTYSNLADYEKGANELLARVGVTQRIPAKLSNRAEQIYSQIKNYIAGKSVLDFGCGDGKVGELIARSGLEVTLADIYRHAHTCETGLEFVSLEENTPAPIDKQYDTTLLLTVLHHSNTPMQTLQDAVRLTKKNGSIIVIESVYGIDDKTAFGRLHAEEQRCANIFFDHFYNRVIHYSDNPLTKVTVPFNFRTPEQWKDVFERNGNVQTGVVCLGIDQPTVPEYHTLHVLRVK
jgi:SAM-dependent methyltransferase